MIKYLKKILTKKVKANIFNISNNVFIYIVFGSIIGISVIAGITYFMKKYKEQQTKAAFIEFMSDLGKENINNNNN